VCTTCVVGQSAAWLGCHTRHVIAHAQTTTSRQPPRRCTPTGATHACISPRHAKRVDCGGAMRTCHIGATSRVGYTVQCVQVCHGARAMTRLDALGRAGHVPPSVSARHGAHAMTRFHLLERAARVPPHARAARRPVSRIARFASLVHDVDVYIDEHRRQTRPGTSVHAQHTRHHRSHGNELDCRRHAAMVGSTTRHTQPCERDENVARHSRCTERRMEHPSSRAAGHKRAWTACVATSNHGTTHPAAAASVPTCTCGQTPNS